MKKIVVYGAGGHAKVILDIINSVKEFSVACYYDDNPTNSFVSGVPVFSKKSDLKNFANTYDIKAAVVAIGNNSARKRISEELKIMGFNLPTLIHSSALISEDVKIGPGTVVMPRVVINSSSEIKEGVILNTGSIIEHDCIVGSFAHIAPGSVLCGGVIVGSMTMVGAGSTIIPLQTIGESSIVGAGSVVIRPVVSNTCVYGNPARAKTS